MKKETRYGISKELADKIDREYDELFGKANSKFGPAPKIKGATEKELVEMMLTDKPSKMIWNVAIEEAAKVIDTCNREGPYNAIGGARRIRKLKK